MPSEAGPERASGEEARHRRELKFRKRDDHAVELFGAAEAALDDPARVDRFLLELGRFYNPYIDAPIVDLATRRAIAGCLALGDREGARGRLRERLGLYTGAGEPGEGSGDGFGDGPAGGDPARDERSSADDH